MKNKRYRIINLKTLKELVEARNTIEELGTLKAEEPQQKQELQELQEVETPEEELPPPHDTEEGIGEGRYAEIFNERGELMTKVKEFEDKLQGKIKLLDEMRKKYKGKEEEYANLEKEYLILYRQQQGLS